MAQPISPEVRALVRKRVPSMDHVEVLMRLHAVNGAPLPEAELRKQTRMGTESVGKTCGDLARARLVKLDAVARTCRYDPADERDRPTVNELVALYNERPVTLVKLIYEQPSTAAQSFADAFRLSDEERE